METATSLWFLESFILLLSDGAQLLAAQYVLAARITTENILVWAIYDFQPPWRDTVLVSVLWSS